MIGLIMLMRCTIGTVHRDSGILGFGIDACFWQIWVMVS